MPDAPVAIMKAVLTLPPASPDPDVRSAESGALWRAGLARLGGPAAEALDRLAGDVGIGPGSAGPTGVVRFDDLRVAAASALAALDGTSPAGALAGAIAPLVMLCGNDASGPDGLIGLAALAVRRDDVAAAAVFAGEALRLAPGHPRAACLAGFAALAAGDRKGAQQLLAGTARLARRRPEYREDLRAAQQLLLIMHLT
ncbi:hypothetical protein [Prosthecomicrobium sp. N25]|uniref:hypothetical protein n=1 Tax=Prosthecomicrobium sp. N25 TaxID=3129254 RepID=UPI003077C4D2